MLQLEVVDSSKIKPGSKDPLARTQRARVGTVIPHVVLGCLNKSLEIFQFKKLIIISH